MKNCQPSTIFINVGRGSIIKSEDLIEALNKKWIRGAILDVFEEEPLNKNSQLWDLENVKSMSKRKDALCIHLAFILLTRF